MVTFYVFKTLMSRGKQVLFRLIGNYYQIIDSFYDRQLATKKKNPIYIINVCGGILDRFNTTLKSLQQHFFTKNCFIFNYSRTDKRN